MSASVENETEPEETPAQIFWTVRCLWISAIAVLLFSAVIILGFISVPAELLPSPGTTALTFGLLALTAVKVRSGRNWARWFFLVIYVLGAGVLVLAAVMTPQFFLALPAVLKLSTLMQTGLQTAALIFIFSKPAREWFAMRKRVA